MQATFSSVKVAGLDPRLRKDSSRPESGALNSFSSTYRTECHLSVGPRLLMRGAVIHSFIRLRRFVFTHEDKILNRSISLCLCRQLPKYYFLPFSLTCFLVSLFRDSYNLFEPRPVFFPQSKFVWFVANFSFCISQ